MEGLRGVDDRLGRNAADMQAGSAEPAVLDQQRVEPKLARADRRDIAARAPADDENLATEIGHVSPQRAQWLRPLAMSGQREPALALPAKPPCMDFTPR